MAAVGDIQGSLPLILPDLVHRVPRHAHLRIIDVKNCACLLRLRRLQDAAGAPTTGPELVLPNDPASPETARVVWTSATSMSFTVYPELGLEPGLYEVTVTNRNGKTATLSAALASVPRPTLASAEPDLVCVAQGGRPITLSGSGFLDVGGALPSVAFGDGLILPVESVADCVDVAGPTPARPGPAS
jgi:hypothetical protein